MKTLGLLNYFQPDSDKQEALRQGLLYAGLNMLASQAPTFGGAFGAGAIKGYDAYQSKLDEIAMRKAIEAGFVKPKGQSVAYPTMQPKMPTYQEMKNAGRFGNALPTKQQGQAGLPSIEPAVPTLVHDSAAKYGVQTFPLSSHNLVTDYGIAPDTRSQPSMFEGYSHEDLQNTLKADKKAYEIAFERDPSDTQHLDWLRQRIVAAETALGGGTGTAPINMNQYANALPVKQDGEYTLPMLTVEAQNSAMPSIMPSMGRGGAEFSAPTNLSLPSVPVSGKELLSQSAMPGSIDFDRIKSQVKEQPVQEAAPSESEEDFDLLRAARAMMKSGRKDVMQQGYKLYADIYEKMAADSEEKKLKTFRWLMSQPTEIQDAWMKFYGRSDMPKNVVAFNEFLKLSPEDRQLYMDWVRSPTMLDFQSWYGHYRPGRGVSPVQIAPGFEAPQQDMQPRAGGQQGRVTQQQGQPVMKSLSPQQMEERAKVQYQDDAALRAINTFADNILANIDALIGKEGSKYHPGLQGALGSIQGTPIGSSVFGLMSEDISNAQEIMKSLESQISVEGMANIRERASSPGAVTEREWPRFENTIKPIGRTQNTSQYAKHLIDLRREILNLKKNSAMEYTKRYGGNAKRSSASDIPDTYIME
jgi:hypothetical protein